MDFSLTAEQEMLRDTARQLLTKECPSTLLREAWDDPSAAGPLWTTHLADWVELADGDLVDLALFMEEHGRAMVPGVFFPTVLAAQIVGSLGMEPLRGSASVAVAGPAGEWVANGSPIKHHVVEADRVEQLLVVAGSAERPHVALVDPTDAPRREVEQLDRLRRQFEVDVGRFDDGEAVDADALGRGVERALVASSAELVGVARWLLETSVEYARERVQFDVPIGSFQGLQWMLVDAALDLERAAGAVAYAAMCVDADDADRHRAVHGAKAEAGLAARRCARTGMQVHGGIGFTFEHDLHLRLRRAYAGDALMAPSAWHHDRLADLIF
jgi:alkylation response protein AidB-like acyl-CoA dehydrogenase